MNNQEAIEILKIERDHMIPTLLPERIEAMDMAISALQAHDVSDTNVGDMVSRQKAIDALCRRCDLAAEDDEPCTEKCNDIKILEKLPSAQPEYEPVKAEDFAKTMSENTLYGFMAWYGETLELMEKQGFVICKKTL